MPTMHDLHITTDQIERTRIFDLPYGYQVTCDRVGGWNLWRAPLNWDPRENTPAVAGDMTDAGLRLDVGGVVIYDTLTD